MIQEQTAPAPTQTAPAPRRRQIDSRYIAPVFISVILLVAQIYYHVLESYAQTLTAILCSLGTEIILSRLLYKKWPHLASAYVSGISVGILVRSTLYWPFALCAVLSIVSKYALRYKGRHLWNPSNFGIATLLFLAPQTVASLGIQWGNSFGAMLVIWTLGSIILWRLKRFHICATYVLSFLALAFLRASLPGHHLNGLEAAWKSEIAPITGPMYQLFIFFMITDPKSTTLTRRSQCLTIFCVAVMECILRLCQDSHAPYNALFIVGPLANFLEIRRGAARSAAAVPATPQA